MSNTPGAQAQAIKHAGRNRPSDIDELRDNIADIAGSVGDMRVTNMSRLTTWQPTLSKKQARSSDAIRCGSFGVGLCVGFLLGFILTGVPAPSLTTTLAPPFFPLLPEIPHGTSTKDARRTVS